MCWMCGAVRPGDGPGRNEKPGWDQFRYLVEGEYLFANEMADWEALNEWPTWDAKDAEGVPYFTKD